MRIKLEKLELTGGELTKLFIDNILAKKHKKVIEEGSRCWRSAAVVIREILSGYVDTKNEICGLRAENERLKVNARHIAYLEVEDRITLLQNTVAHQDKIIASMGVRKQ